MINNTQERPEDNEGGGSFAYIDYVARLEDLVNQYDGMLLALAMYGGVVGADHTTALIKLRREYSGTLTRAIKGALSRMGKKETPTPDDPARDAWGKPLSPQTAKFIRGEL